jgi:RES domain-containing protein
VRAYRIADGRRPIFDPTGAFLHGGRWNSAGKRVIYAAQTYAGALLDVLVHANIGVVPTTQALVEITIPDGVSVETVEGVDVEGWASDDLVASRQFGDGWLDQRRTAVLLVPSVALQGRERNVLINPDHPDSVRIRAGAPEAVVWDPRLFSRRR